MVFCVVFSVLREVLEWQRLDLQWQVLQGDDLWPLSSSVTGNDVEEEVSLWPRGLGRTPVLPLSKDRGRPRINTFDRQQTLSQWATLFSFIGGVIKTIQLYSCLLLTVGMLAKLLQSRPTSVMFDSVTLWTVACPAPLSMGLPRQEHWSGLPCPPPGDLPNPGIEPASLRSPALAGGFFNTSAACTGFCFSFSMVMCSFLLK